MSGPWRDYAEVKLPDGCRAVEPTTRKLGNAYVWKLQCRCGGFFFESPGRKLGKEGPWVCGNCKSERKDRTKQHFPNGCRAVSPTNKRRGNCVVWKFKCRCGRPFFAVPNEVLREGPTRCQKCANATKDYTQEVFENGCVAIKPTKRRNVWKFKCKCGVLFYDMPIAVRARIAGCTSCRRQSKYKDYTGCEYGWFVVAARIDQPSGPPLWERRCLCGRVTHTTHYTVGVKTAVSCGCFQRVRQFFRHMGIKTNRDFLVRFFLSNPGALKQCLDLLNESRRLREDRLLARKAVHHGDEKALLSLIRR